MKADEFIDLLLRNAISFEYDAARDFMPYNKYIEVCPGCDVSFAKRGEEWQLEKIMVYYRSRRIRV
jgi:hypothetical protein